MPRFLQDTVIPLKNDNNVHSTAWRLLRQAVFGMTGMSMLCGESPLGGSYRPTRKRLPRFAS